MEPVARGPAAACASAWGAAWVLVALSASITASAVTASPLVTFPVGKLAAASFALLV